MVHLRVPSGCPCAGLGWSVPPFGWACHSSSMLCARNRMREIAAKLATMDEKIAQYRVRSHHVAVCGGRGACTAAGTCTQPFPTHPACQAAKRELKGSLVDKLTMTPKQIRQKAKSA